MENRDILVVLEKINGEISSLSTEMLGRASYLADRMGQEVLALSMGSDISKMSQEAIYYGADKVVEVEDRFLENYTTLAYTKVLNAVLDKYKPSAVFIPATQNGRDLGGRISARRQIGLVADCIDVVLDEDNKTFKWIRPTFDGQLYADIRVSTKPEVGTIGDGAFRPLNRDENRKGEILKEDVQLTADDVLTIVLEQIKDDEKEVSLSDAKVIVSGGMGIGSKDNWHLITDLAEELGAEVGATKDVIDQDWLPYNRQIGSTGVRVSPRLYIAVGISGAIQHTAGMKTSDLIIAINNNPEAPIFKVAHYGIVGDLFEIVPKLTEKIKEINNK
ncbi:electron transfer flavoprotein subunit alpha/FixB family protein [Anaerosphaera multitolerans]|uniref:Electron transfer flavoprotein subunit alpha/FixB family protein n=1 Tax=Anaerosphaera multitolerans TaxID=2487351 RepID=A0A437S4T5_9FIRM|nr:electron transfer flavoprotein subunit alpha/FixB family protein [Anaerosphaera multitolerans]RVU54045.1 electron transfer flavoprotein subunit alpha/FixB family protein [Anaerosphaera multitolerans]